jgi:hypothetical protein
MRNAYWLKGGGMGLRAKIARVVQLELIGARKIGTNPGANALGQDADGLSDRDRLWFIASAFF